MQYKETVVVKEQMWLLPLVKANAKTKSLVPQM